MADPLTIGLTILSAATSAIGAAFQGQAAADAANYNATIQEQNAARARSEGAARSEQSVRRSRQILGSQRAAIAQSGFGFTGSFADLMEKSEVNADLDALTLAYEGEAAARGYQNRANLYRSQGDNAKKAGFIGAATAALGGLSKGYGAMRGYGATGTELGDPTRLGTLY